MAFFCLCTARAIVGDRAMYKVDTYSVADLNPALFDERKTGVLPPERPMGQSNGHRQFLADRPHVGENVKPGDVVREHFPNVDIIRCHLCGAGFVRQ